jgi:predicted nucleotidyltransferase
MDPLITKAVEAMLSSAPMQGRRVIACWAFGSRAAGKGRVGSDVDLAVPENRRQTGECNDAH